MDKEFDNELANLWKPFGRGIYRKEALFKGGNTRVSKSAERRPDVRSWCFSN